MSCRSCGKTRRAEKSYPDRQACFIPATPVPRTVSENIMKLIVSLAATLLAATLASCGESTPPPSTAPVESASEAARKDDREIAVRLAAQKAAADAAFRNEQDRAERQKLNEAFEAVLRRWGESLDEAARTSRGDAAVIIKKLEGIKAEAEALTGNECINKARAGLVTSMSAEIEAINMFRKETGEVSTATKQQQEKAAALQAAAEQEFQACKKVS